MLQAKALNLNEFTPNLSEELSDFLREYVEEFDKDTEQILAIIFELPFKQIEHLLAEHANLKKFILSL